MCVSPCECLFTVCAFCNLSGQEVHAPTVIPLHCPLRVRETDVCLLFLGKRAVSSLQCFLYDEPTMVNGIISIRRHNERKVTMIRVSKKQYMLQKVFLWWENFIYPWRRKPTTVCLNVWTSFILLSITISDPYF